MIIRKINKRTFAIVEPTSWREKARFSKSSAALNQQEAENWLKQHRPHLKSVCREIVLFQTDDQLICRITDDGDSSEPAGLQKNSLIRITDGAGREMVFLACELTDLSKQWLQRIKNQEGNSRSPRIQETHNVRKLRTS